MRKILYILAFFVLVFVLVNEAKATDGNIYTHNSVLGSGRWVKIGVTETGINTITPALIQQCGFSDMSRIKVYGYGGALQPEALTESYLKDHDDLQEVATYTFNGQKYFFGQGPVSWVRKTTEYRTRNPYSSYGCYFITEGDNPMSCTEEELLQIANEDFSAYHSLYENDNYALVETGANLFDKTSFTKGSSASYNVVVPAKSTTATITVAVATTTSGTTYTISSSLTGESKSATFGSLGSYGKVLSERRSLRFSSDDLAKAEKDASGNYIVPVTVSNLNGASSAGTLYLDFVSAVYDASNIPSTIEGGSFPEASYIYSITNQNHHADESRDLIVVIPSTQGNLAQAQRLCKLHEQKDGITTRIIPVDEIYSEFSSGTPDITAIRRYLKMFYDRDNTNMPKWVLLMGKAYFDNRGLTGGNDVNSLVPVFETDDLYRDGVAMSTAISTTSSFCSEDYITCLEDGKYANMYSSSWKNASFDIAVGRIPASTDTEAKIYVDKIEHYMDSKYNGKWQRDIMFVGGNGNEEERKSDPFTHIKQIDENADLVIGRHLGYDVKKVYTPAYTAVASSTGTTYPQATTEVIKQQDNGALIMDYGGHGSATQLAFEKVLMLSDFKNFSGKNYSVWITAACETMPYDMSGSCLGVTAVENSDGGAIAFIGTSRTVYAGQNTSLNKTLMYHLLTYTSLGTPITIGEALRRTKCCLISSNGYSPYASQTESSYNKHQYNLIGDPALKINLPKDSVIVDEVTHEMENTAIEGLEKVTVKGTICDTDGGEQVYSTNTKVFLKVYDSTVKESCTEDSKSFSFNKRNMTLFEGVTKFNGKQFEATFRVPEELNDNGGNGQILFYVIDGNNTDRVAKCEYNEIKFSGDMEHPTVTEAPNVYCYFNDRNFVSGDAVGGTPFFVAELSDDEGLYVSESTGHNLELVIDGSADMTYNLNSNFTFDYSSYTSGQTWYVLPKLADGYHTARFRVWNILGTLTTKELTFRVVNSKEPNLADIFIGRNPIQTGATATFYVLSDFTGSDADIFVDIFDTAGRLCCIIPYANHSLGDDLEAKNYEDTRQYRNRTDLTWTVQGLASGMYLYRVRMTCDGHNYSSKSKKLIVTQ